MSIRQGNSIIASKPVWGGIGGTLSNQTDLQNALDSKANSADVYTKAEVNTIANGKASIALDNLSTVGQGVCANMAMPDWDKRINITLPASGSQLIAPTDGYFCIVLDVAANSYLSVGANYYQMGNNNGYVGGYYATKKGFAPYVFYSNRINTIECCFVPCVGA